MKSFSLLHPRDQIVSIMERIYGHEMTTTSGGNISVQDENGDVWITPARMDKGNLRRQDIVRIRPNGEHEGAHPPYSLLMPLTIQLHSQRQTAFNLERW